jgi:hypothetical protein
MFSCRTPARTARHYEQVRDVVAYLRSRLAEYETEAETSRLHRTGCPAGVSVTETCTCDYPKQLIAGIVAQRELIDEFVHWLESEDTSERTRARTHRALLLLVQPWSQRPDFDQYWRLDS